jgi:hypothetical protein
MIPDPGNLNGTPCRPVDDPPRSPKEDFAEALFATLVDLFLGDFTLAT